MKHMFGVRVEGKLYRLAQEYTDQEFQDMTKFGLPENVVAFHWIGPVHWAVIKKLPAYQPVSCDDDVELRVWKYQWAKDPSGYGVCRHCELRPAWGLYRGLRVKETPSGRDRLVPVNKYVCEGCAEDFIEMSGRCGVWLKARKQS